MFSQVGGWQRQLKVMQGGKCRAESQSNSSTDNQVSPPLSICIFTPGPQGLPSLTLYPVTKFSAPLPPSAGLFISTIESLPQTKKDGDRCFL